MSATYEMSLSDYLNYLPGYDLFDEGSEVLDIARTIIDSENYFCRGYCFPLNGDDNLDGLENFEGQLAVPYGSIIVWMSGYSSQPAGFKFQLFDNGAKHNLFGRTFARGENVTGVGGGAGLEDIPRGPAWMSSPMIIIPPGRITMQVTNLASVAATIQIYMNIAVPITRETLGQNVIHTQGAS